jgi:hypothetical protein
MQLYNASTGVGIRNFARRFSNTNSTTYSDADLNASINAYYDLFTTEILQSMDDWDFQGEYATTDTVANQQEYAFPAELLKIKDVEITYDGSTWYKAAFMDINERSNPNDTTSVANDFSESSPYVDFMDNSLFLYPVPTSAVTAGLKIYYEKLPTAMSADSDTPTLARPFHIGLAYGGAKDWLEQHIDMANNVARLNVANDNLNKTIKAMKDFYNKHIQDRDYVVLTPYVDYEYGNN